MEPNNLSLLQRLSVLFFTLLLLSSPFFQLPLKLLLSPLILFQPARKHIHVTSSGLV